MKELSLEQMANVEGEGCDFATGAVLAFWASGIGFAFGAASAGIGFAAGLGASLIVAAVCAD
ncbi:MAG: hypothetical protein RIM99_06750 [Cyclobacteriaceae bacterium]